MRTKRLDARPDSFWPSFCKETSMVSILQSQLPLARINSRRYGWGAVPFAIVFRRKLTFLTICVDES
jgi:hypothetical protein